MISPRLTEVFRSSVGNKFFGLLSDPEDRFEGDRIQARRILRVNPQTVFNNGEVVSNKSDRYLLIQHATNRYLAFRITHDLSWVRTVKIIDPVTHMEREGVDQTLNTKLPVVVEPIQVMEDYGLERVRYRLRAGGDFLAGDRLGPYTIHSVQNVSGACVMDAY